MIDHEKQIQRGEEASRILNSQVFADAFENVRLAYVRTWEGLPTADVENAQDVHRRLKALADVRKALETHVQTGKLAQKALTRLQKAEAYAKKLNPFANG